MTVPYRDTAHAYLAAGWRGVLWLPPTTKWPPPKGYTGHDGAWPSPADVQTWTEDHPDGNIALRMPEGVLGLDVDAYGAKPGGASLVALEGELGVLPPTVLSTSRSDGVSGIRLYRVPPAPRWPNQAGDGIELIHFGHRYAVVWPSLHDEAPHNLYRWIDQRTGETLAAPPTPTELPDLPEAWVEHLQGRAGGPTDKTDVAPNEVTDWLAGLRPGDPCAPVAEALAEAQASLTSGRQARHDVMVAGSGRLVGLGAWGHAGVAAALGTLRAGFIDASTTPGPGQRSTDDAIAEWRRAVAGAVALRVGEQPEPAAACSCPMAAFNADVEESFWSAREELAQIRRFARARRTSPWAVLCIALARLVVATPPTYVLPAMIGGRASLNLFVGVVARSGGGKGASEAAAADAVDVGREIHSTGVGSGEGIVHQYVRYVPENKKTQEPARIDQHNDAVLFTAAEVDTLGNLAGRQGSTLLAELRKVYMGEELSFAYVDPTKRLKVDKHRYRAGLVVGVQPARAATLLDDADGGTPQRFLWVPGMDAGMPDEAPDEPDPIVWSCPTSLFSDAEGQLVLKVCDVARETIDLEHVKRNRGDGDALDGHALLTRLKWAAALGLLDSRLSVDEEDWELAGTLMTMSDHTRGGVVSALHEQKSAANRAAGRELADRELVKDEVLSEGSARRVAQTLKRKLDRDGPLTRGELRRSVTSRDRGWFEEALERLLAAGDVEWNGESGADERYRATGRTEEVAS